MAQETFLIAKSVLRKFKDPPETRRLEFISPTTLEACSRAARNLQHLEMTSEESEILDQSQNIEMVREFIAQYVAEVDKRRQYSKTWGKVYAFSQFAGPVLDVFKQANFSPECSVALGLISLLLIQPLNNKSDIEERLEKEIMQLKDIISQVEFSKSNIRTAEIDAEVQGLCGAIIDFLVHALQYQKKWGIAKVLSGILADFAKRFESFVTKIKSHATKIGVLAQRGYTTILLNSKDILDTTAQAVQDLQTHVITQTTIFDLKVARLENKISQCKRLMDTSITFSAIQHAQSLSAILFPHLPSLEDQMISIRQRETLLAPREHWMSNVSEIQAPGWLSHSPRPLLWIGGRRNRRGISWVSSFTLDVVEALKMEPSVKVVYTLCDNAALMSQLIVFKHLIVQLLRAYPEILLVPENLNDLPVQRLAGIGDSTELAYRVLADIIRMVNQQCHRDGKEVFLLIDRVDVVLTMEDSKGKLRFLKALKQLLVEYRALRMILTSEYSMEEIEIGKEGREATVEIWVDTTKPVTMHSRQ